LELASSVSPERLEPTAAPTVAAFERPQLPQPAVRAMMAMMAEALVLPPQRRELACSWGSWWLDPGRQRGRDQKTMLFRAVRACA